MANILKIDTSNSKQISVGIQTSNNNDVLTEESTFLKSEAVLPAIEKILQKNNLKLDDIERIEASKGPGSFTGLRVGVAIANALSFLLKIPVNKKIVGELEEPVYNE